jgi:hypothetical protein
MKPLSLQGPPHFWVKAHYGGAKTLVTLYYFPHVSMLELQPW